MSTSKKKESVNPLEQYNTDIQGTQFQLTTGVNFIQPLLDSYSQQLQNDISQIYQERAIFGISNSFLISDSNTGNMRWMPNGQPISENTLRQTMSEPSTYVFPSSITASTISAYWDDYVPEKKAKKRSPLPKWW